MGVNVTVQEPLPSEHDVGLNVPAAVALKATFPVTDVGVDVVSVTFAVHVVVEPAIKLDGEHDTVVDVVCLWVGAAACAVAGAAIDAAAKTVATTAQARRAFIARSRCRDRAW